MASLHVARSVIGPASFNPYLDNYTFGVVDNCEGSPFWDQVFRHYGIRHFGIRHSGLDILGIVGDVNGD